MYVTLPVLYMCMYVTLPVWYMYMYVTLSACCSEEVCVINCDRVHMYMYNAIMYNWGKDTKEVYMYMCCMKRVCGTCIYMYMYLSPQAEN